MTILAFFRPFGGQYHHSQRLEVLDEWTWIPFLVLVNARLGSWSSWAIHVSICGVRVLVLVIFCGAK